MPTETLEKLATSAQQKVELLNRNRSGYFILSALAGIYVGFGIILIFAIGAPLAAASSPFAKAVMGASFAIALSLVIFAGSELFTGNNLFLVVGSLSRRTRWSDLGRLWAWSYAGNLVGSVALAWFVVQSGVLSADPQRDFILSTVATKMSLPFGALFFRGILCNWLVCLAVWMTQRTSSDAAKLILIFWCLFGFIGAGFEHSVANMTLLSIGLFLPHPEAISPSGLVANLVPVTLGNIVGGSVFVGGLYWLSAREPARQTQAAMALERAAVEGAR